MRKFLALGLLMALFIGTASAALFESGTKDAQPTVLYGKYNNTIVPVKVAADGSVGAGGVSDEAYSADWNGVTDEGASKNALYDKIETIVAGGLDFALDSTTTGNIRYVGCSDNAQTAIDAASSGDTLQFGACTRSEGTALTIDKPLTIRGMGIDVTIFNVTAAISLFTTADNINNVKFQDFSVTGNTLSPVINTNSGSTSSITGVVIKNIKVTGTTTAAAGFNGALNLSNSSGYIDNVYIDVLDTAVATSGQVVGIRLNYTSACDADSTWVTRNVYSRVSSSSTATGGSQLLRGIMQYGGNPGCNFNATHYHYNGKFIADNLNEATNSITTNGMHMQEGSGTGVMTSYIIDSSIDGGEQANTYSNTKNIDLRCDDNAICNLIRTSIRNGAIDNGGTVNAYDGGVLHVSGVYGRYQTTASLYADGQPTLDLIGQIGGNENQSGSRTGKTGGLTTLVGGAGGTVTSTDAGTKTGGVGGGFSFTGGVGGDQTLTVATNVGGVGGGASLIGGAGGATANGTGTNTGGAGGSIYLTPGAGGAGATATGADGNTYIGVNSSGTTVGNIGLGTNTPLSAVDIEDTVGPVVTFSRNNVSVAADDVIGQMDFFTNDSATVTQNIAARIKIIAQETIGFGQDKNPARMEFHTNSNGTATSPTNKMTILSNGGVIVTPTGVQTIATTNTISADSCGTIKEIDSAGAVTTSTTNTFTAPGTANDGCCMDVINSGANNITLDANANFISNGAADVVLGAGDSARVCSNGTDWYQIGATGNN